MYRDYQSHVYKNSKQVFHFCLHLQQQIRISSSSPLMMQIALDQLRSASPCVVIQKDKSQGMKHGGLERAYLESHLGHSPANNSYICKKRLVEARRYGHDKNHVPAWKERMPPKKQTCFNPNCENKSSERLIKPMFIPNDKLMETLGVNQTTEVNQPL